MAGDAHLFFEGITKLSSLPVKRPPFIADDVEHLPAALPNDDFYSWLFQRSGLNVEHYRTNSLGRRIQACLRAVGAKSVEEARRRIEADPSLMQPAIDAVLLGVTEFSRDPSVFNYLQDHVVPEFGARGRQTRIWSAACSDGQELYSAAILLSDCGMLRNCDLLGTDCRSEAIERAKMGLFPLAAMAKLDASARARHFHGQGVSARVSDELRQSLRWKVADLFAGTEPGPWDMIMWRNMAIYLTSDAADRIWRALVKELRPDGYLVVGKADHPPAGLGLRRIATCVYQKSEEAK